MFTLHTTTIKFIDIKLANPANKQKKKIYWMVG